MSVERPIPDGSTRPPDAERAVAPAHPRSRPGSPAPRWRWLPALVVFLLASALSVRTSVPPLPSPLELEVQLGPAGPERSEPLIVTGRTGAGDFLFVRHLPGGSLAIGHESWGEPPRLSEPLPRPADGRLRLTVAMPALGHVRGVFAAPDPRLQVTANGNRIFDTSVRHHLRQPADAWFGENPIGGTACGPRLDGVIRLPDGRELRGRPAALWTPARRALAWVNRSPWRPVSALAAGLLAGLLWPRIPWRGGLRLLRLALRGRRALAADAAGARLLAFARAHRAFALTGGAATLAFAGMVSYGTLDLVEPETFADFYDHQAASLLSGRLDVPPDALGGEAFVHGGKTYGYFGLTPALLRVPFVIHDAAFGELTRAFMVAGFALALLASRLLLGTAYSLAGHGRPGGWASGVLAAAAGLGSTVFFLGSRAYVYHEAILWGVAFALLAAWAALRHLAAPGGRWWQASLAAGVLSVHARPPTGLFALTLLGTVALVLLWRDRRVAGAVRRQVRVGILCALGVFSFNAVSYLKFGTFEGCPLRYNVQYDAVRLARIEGRQFHLENIPLAIECYLLRPNFRLEAGFPYFYIDPGVPSMPWLETKIDYHDNTLGFPYAMPALAWLAAAGGILGLRRAPALRPALLATWAAALPMTLAMFAAIAITHRYTADFCPFLITAAALGLAGGEELAGPRRRSFRALTLVTVVASVLVTLAITLHHQGQEVWGVPEDVRARYAALRQGIDAAFGSSRP